MSLYQHENSIYKEHIHIERYSNFFFPPHFHKDLEFVLPLKGSVELHIDGKRQILNEEQLALVLSNQIHAFASPNHSDIIVVNFSTDYVGSFMRIVEGKIGEGNVFASTDIFSNYLKQEYSKSPESIDHLTIKATCYAICAKFLQQIQLVSNRKNNSGGIYNILNYVSERYREDISLKNIAQALGYNTNYVSQVFHQFVNMNFRQYVNQYRVEYACHLLRENTLTISEIALESGFQTLRSFNRAFYSQMCVTPSKYKHGERTIGKSCNNSYNNPKR